MLLGSKNGATLKVEDAKRELLRVLIRADGSSAADAENARRKSSIEDQALIVYHFWLIDGPLGEYFTRTRSCHHRPTLILSLPARFRHQLLAFK
jgi:hypothetical protein